ncbi:hypothetical protein D0U02_22795 [Burkholderia pseudomallei]|nr:hypothetical protein BOC51_33825 [Burkholderia pseudomallei]EDS82831.1 hypothetical protein BURPSS13_K0176 [Burkholderia pseudomallei S13]AYX04159.1 hypothetical protein EGY14_10180 [Burkholderia pseudomallei]AYX38067.1 hypothetical protein EGY15_23490 [Burkholderia pseudomallei]MPT66609.1 hypothetical protein [Burkholderia pseudomallei]
MAEAASRAVRHRPRPCESARSRHDEPNRIGNWPIPPPGRPAARPSIPTSHRPSHPSPSRPTLDRPPPPARGRIRAAA